MESKLKCVFDLQFIEVNENTDNNKEPSLSSLTSSTKIGEEIGVASNNEQSLGSNVYVKV